MLDKSWRASRYGKVYAVLAASLDAPSGGAAPGTIAEIGRAIDYFRARGRQSEVEQLTAISVTVATLHEALRARDERARLSLRHQLSEQAKCWLLAAPMGHDELFGSHRAA